MKVLVFEPNHGGHRYDYVRLLISELSTLDVDVTLASTSTGFQSEEFDAHLGSQTGTFQQFECPKVDRSTSRKLANSTRASLRISSEEVSPDHTYVTVGGGLTQLLGFRRSLGLRPVTDSMAEAIHFGGGFGYQSESHWKKKISICLNQWMTYRSPWDRYLHVDPFQLGDLCKRNPAFAKRSTLLPDPVESIEISMVDARRELELPLNCILLGCAGRMDKRKGIDLLVEAFAKSLTKLPSETRLLLFGKFTEYIRGIVSSQPESVRHRIICRDRLLTDREFDLVIPALDAVCTAYSNHFGSSGVVLRSIAAGRPVVGSNHSWMGKMIPLLSAGVTCDAQNVESLRDALIGVAADARSFSRSAAADRYLEFQSPANFKATLTSFLRTRLGVPQNESLVPWQTVNDNGQITTTEF